MSNRNRCLWPLTCMLLTACLSSVGLAANPNLVGWWSFNEGDGAVVADGSGNGNDGTLVNTTWVEGQLGSALGFDGSAYVDIPPQAWETISAQFTFTFWVYIPNADISQSNFIVGAFSDPANNDARVFSAHLPWGGATVYYDTSGPGYDRTSLAISPAELTDAWNHWAFTKNADTGDVMIYRNGELWHSDTGKNKPLQGPDITKFTIGTKPSLAEGWFTGMIDDVQLYNVALSQEEIQQAMAGISLVQATGPVPESETADILRDTVLSWVPGAYAATHNVYVGASFEDVNSATAPTAEGLTAASFDPGRLDFGQTYFWRVDEVNGTPDKTVFRGEIWSFTAEPYSIQIPESEITVTASSFSNEFSQPEKVIDGSGLGADGSCATTPETMWFTASPDMDPWIQFEFSDLKQLDTMVVYNSNGAAESAIGWGVKDVVIEYSEDGENWTVLEGANQFSRAPGLATYNQPDEIAFNGVPAKYVRLDIASNWGGILMSYGLSEVQFNMIPAQARTPVPGSGSGDILPDAVATWRAGRSAAQHTVYIGTDADAVADGTAPSVISSTSSLDLGTLDLRLGETYYWRVDEVNEAETVPVWEGPVWSLSITSAVVVDDFEGYGNASPDRPFQAWLDGFGYSADEFFPAAYGGNGTGAGIGHDIWSLSSPYYDGDIMESAIVIAGSTQSLPFYFDNSGGAASQTDRTFATPQNWSAGGVTTLTVAVRGNPSLAAANQLYVKINNAKVTYDGDLSVPIWQQWQVDLTSLGINLSSVTTMSFGVDGSGSGMVLLDDILLHRTAPPVMGPPAGGDKSLVAHWKLDETEGLTAADSSGYGNHGTLVGMDGTEWVAGHDGGALEITGASSTTPKYVDFGGPDSLQIYGSVTISAWVKMNAGNDGVYMGIGGKLISGYYRGFALVRHSSNVFRLWADNEGQLAGFDASSDATYTDTEWHHVAGVVDDGTSILYVDGVRQAIEGDVNLTDSAGIAYIGKQYGDDSSHRYWNGMVDDMRIYYRALSEQEISGL